MPNFEQSGGRGVRCRGKGVFLIANARWLAGWLDAAQRSSLRTQHSVQHGVSYAAALMDYRHHVGIHAVQGRR